MLCEGVAGQVTHLCIEFLCVSVCARSRTLTLLFFYQVSRRTSQPLFVLTATRKSVVPGTCVFLESHE